MGGRGRKSYMVLAEEPSIPRNTTSERMGKWDWIDKDLISNGSRAGEVNNEDFRSC